MKLQRVEFIVKNINRAIDFYEKVGFKISRHQNQTIYFKTDDENTYFAISEPKNHKDLPGKQSCVFSTDNLEGLFQKCKLVGVPVEADLFESDNGKQFIIRDPDGNKLEFVAERETKREPKDEEEKKVEEKVEVTQERADEYSEPEHTF